MNFPGRFKRLRPDAELRPQRLRRRTRRRVLTETIKGHPRHTLTHLSRVSPDMIHILRKKRSGIKPGTLQFLAYHPPREERALVDRELYLSVSWTDDRD